MELKEYISIFRKNLQLFAAIVFLFIITGVLFQLFRPLEYKTSLNLNVTRTGTQLIQGYRYDNFYRLQADEKFADTVVRWLNSPRIATDILNDSKIIASGLSQRSLQKFFKAQRLSSQMVLVTYSTKNADIAKDLSKSVVKIINAEADKLNQRQNEESWFMVVGDEPVVKENVYPWGIAILFSSLMGIFIGFWVVLIRHYLSD